MSDVEINVNDLMNAFTSEIADLSRRAVIAEQKSKALQRALDMKQAEVDALRAAAAQVQSEVAEPDGAMDAVSPRPVSKGRA